MIAVKRGDFAAAMPAFREAAQIFTEDNDLSGLTIIASKSAELAAAQGDLERQAVLVGLADALAERAGTGILREIAHQDGRALATDIAPEFRPALERGRAMETAAGIAYALDDSALKA